MTISIYSKDFSTLYNVFSGTYVFKLGMESSFKNYVNQYSINNIALNKTQKMEERDKKRHMSYKFSLTAAAEFKWPGNIYSELILEKLLKHVRSVSTWETLINVGRLICVS